MESLRDTIKEGNKEFLHSHVKTPIFLHHYLRDGLKIESLTKKAPQIYWKKLTEIFDNQRTIVLLKACYEWLHLEDFKTQYRERDFKRYSELISCQLVAKQNNELLMKNRRLCLTRSVPLLEANAISRQKRRHGHTRGCEHGFGRRRELAHEISYGQNNE
ncbi:uncharacterized protein LOC111398239 [Olea europaea var. sylvestris]|uniref:uncharacterized protein LOC111398239 n=1 Tax=Olea europaea var. sylvestris TaxID=158386 RepID=UPI000C1D0446|nr:uncharacterized protein LOC111398239 [Olea europaea var. sylvestris]